MLTDKPRKEDETERRAAEEAREKTTTATKR
jgi:hypothetical protein